MNFALRSVYPFNTPGAFVPHSAINLSRSKEEESPGSQSLDLSVSESGPGVTGVSVSSGSSGSGLVSCFRVSDWSIVYHSDYEVLNTKQIKHSLIESNFNSTR